MKDKTLIIFIILIIGLGLSILFYELNQVRQMNPDTIEQPSPTQIRSNPTAEPEPQEAGTSDQELETQPTISDQTDLETLEQELEQTEIIEEDFSDL